MAQQPSEPAPPNLLTSAPPPLASAPPPPTMSTQQQPPPPTPRAAAPRGSSEKPRPTTVVNSYDHKRATWGLGDFFASLAIYFVVGLGLVVLIFAISGTNELPQGPWMVLALAGPQTSQFIHLRWVSRKKGTGLANDFQLRFARLDLRLGLRIFLAAMVAAAFAAYAVTTIAGEAPVSSAMTLAEDSSDGGITLWIMLFALIGATFIPVVEELVFRGLLWSALEKRGVRPGTILVATSAVFALVHLEPWRTPVLFAIGLALGYGRLRTGRIGASIVVHCSINTTAMLATLMTIS